MKLVSILMALTLSSMVVGQTTQPDRATYTYDEAMARLQAKEAQREKPVYTEAQYDKLVAENRVLRQKLQELQKQIDALTQQATRASQATTAIQPSQPSNSAIANAIKAKKLAVGMTMDEAKRALGAGLLLVSEDESGKIYKWILSQYDGANLVGRAYVFAKFTDGKVTAWQQVSKDVAPPLQ